MRHLAQTVNKHLSSDTVVSPAAACGQHRGTYAKDVTLLLPPAFLFMWDQLTPAGQREADQYDIVVSQAVVVSYPRAIFHHDYSSVAALRLDGFDVDVMGMDLAVPSFPL